MLDFNKYGPEPVQPVNSNWQMADDMRRNDLAFDSDLIADGKLHRFSLQGEKGNKKSGWYVLHVDTDFSAGSYGSWKTGEHFTWCSRTQSDMTDAEREEYRKRMEELRRMREVEQAKVQAECIEWCRAEISKAVQAPEDHPYLKRKQIQPCGALLYKDSLMIPVSECGVQFIKPDGTKMFKTGTRLKGGSYTIKGSGKVVVCEGFATGASIHQATGYTVVVAFNAGNLVDVAKIVKPDIIAADNDHQTEGNPGLKKGEEAAKAVGARLVYPAGIKGTDFNDLHCEKGLSSVSEYFKERAMPVGPVIKSANNLLQTEFEPIRWAIEGLLPEGLAVLSGPPKLGKSWLSLDMCLSIVTGGMTAGQFPAEHGSVLLCAMEDNERRLKSRLKMRSGAGMRMPLTGVLDFNLLNDPDLTGFNYTTCWRRLDEGGLDDIKSFLDDNSDCKLVVLDTLAKVKPVAKGKGNAYETDYNDMGALQTLALEKHCCILLITHNRKTETDDPLQSISGSTGITGVMDTILILKRGRSQTGASLYVTGRDINEHTWALNFDGEHGAWTVTGDYEESNGTHGNDAPLQEEVMQVLQKMFNDTGRGAKLKDLFEEMGGATLAPEKSSISRALGKLERKGQIYKSGSYWIPKIN